MAEPIQKSAGTSNRTMLGAITQGSRLVYAGSKRAGAFSGMAARGYSEVRAQTLNGGGDYVGIFTKVAGAAESTTLDVGAEGDVAGTWYELPAGAAADTSAAATGVGVALSVGPIVAALDSISIAVSGQGRGGAYDSSASGISYTPGAGWVEDCDVGNSGNGHPSVWTGHRSEYGLVTASATSSPSADNDWAMQVASFTVPWAPGAAGSPRGLSGAPEYVIEFFDSGSTFGPNTKLGEVWDARNVGWSRYDRLPGKAFFTLAQSSAILPLLTQLTTHVVIWRITPNGDTIVYRGVYIDSNNTGDDVILDCYDYLSLLSVSRSGFKTLYPTKKLGTEIVSPEWALAKGATSSPLGFVATGTIEDPLGTDNVTPIKTNAQFGTLDQTRLQLFYDLTEMGRANTVNQVTYEIDLNNVFNFWKNRGSASSLALVLGGNISDYGYLPGWTRYRNDVATVGMASAGGATEIVAKNAAEITAKALRQDVTTLKTLAGIGGGSTEADQQKAALERELKRLVQQQSALMLRVARGKVEPFVGYGLNDTALVEISNGNDLITGARRIVGLRCLFSEAGEDVDLMVAQVAS